eukprot:538215-Pelagomonas_calceolata.AAC.5
MAVLDIQFMKVAWLELYWFLPLYYSVRVTGIASSLIRNTGVKESESCDSKPDRCNMFVLRVLELLVQD